ncbi:MAG: SET domain-containing protein-lysine N-methyltransferase [Usitatibacter sp.]
MQKWRRFYDTLYVARSSFTGKGLFAGTRIPARAKIGDYEGEVIGLKEARRRAKGQRIVAIVELEKFAIDASDWKHGFRFINHSCDPNVFIRCTPARAEFYARRTIPRGEELVCDYGESQHNGTLPCRCGAANCRGYI